MKTFDAPFPLLKEELARAALQPNAGSNSMQVQLSCHIRNQSELFVISENHTVILGLKRPVLTVEISLQLLSVIAMAPTQGLG